MYDEFGNYVGPDLDDDDQNLSGDEYRSDVDYNENQDFNLEA